MRAVMLLLIPAIAFAQEESIPVAKLPAEIRNAVTARYPGAPITGASKETEDGKTFFEVSVKVNGKNVDVTATQAGQLTLIEREIARKELPAAVAALLDSKYPKAKYSLVEDVSSVGNDGKQESYFEIQLTDAAKVAWEVQVARDGSKIIKTEQKKPGKPD